MSMCKVGCCVTTLIFGGDGTPYKNCSFLFVKRLETKIQKRSKIKQFKKETVGIYMKTESFVLFIPNRLEGDNANKELFSPECSPEEHILFLKTHKTGSSTITNIFFRYGDLRDLSFVLSDDTRLGWPRRFQVTFPRLLQSKSPNILCSHARFNQKPMNWLFPKQTSKYITILRNPVDNFESVFRYMKLGLPLGVRDGPDSLQTFLKNVVSFGKFKTVKASPLIRNPLLYDLGLSFKYYQNLTAVNEYIQFLDKEFDLVMIMDYFDESLVLMKRLLCWQMEDILYLKLNERHDKEKDTVLTDDVRENVKRWNKADVLLFEHFNRSFWKKIENEGESFQ